MIRLSFIFVTVILGSDCNVISSIFHEESKITLQPDQHADYFGYTVVLDSSSLLVGAPKAKSRIKPSISPGVVFNCSLSNMATRNVTCYPLTLDDNREITRYTSRDFFRDDMWFGATIEVIPSGKIMICAPRWATPYTDKHLLANGACYVQTSNRVTTLLPLRELNHQAHKLDGSRKEYGEYGTHLNFYAHGQAGISIKATGNNSVIIGAPGLLQWAGGIVDYKYDPRPNNVFFIKQETTNPYYTKELGPDDYFGYSVESGIFEDSGEILYIAGAPRSKGGYGQVLIFEPEAHEKQSLRVKAKVIGPQLGSYFGSSLCAADIDGDSRTDLLVGAPNYVKKDGGLPFDQGAVFVYLTRPKNFGFVLVQSSFVWGSGHSGARFGTTIACLGDVDNDGFKDFAIGAPWENEGLGVVYIYKGHKEGLRNDYVQKIVAEKVQSFGISISKGVDIDHNNCNDLAIGAYKSDKAFLYRCVPTIQVRTSIKVPDAMDLPQNATNFTALFCVTVPYKKAWPHVKIDLQATIIIDPESSRAELSGDSSYTLIAKPGKNLCEEQVIEVKNTADLSKPISITFQLEIIDNIKELTPETGRLSEDSILKSYFEIQLTRDCGEDLICVPWLELSLEPWTTSYTPGTNISLGLTVIVFNKEEPAYGAKVNLVLPLSPKRVPSQCSLKGLNMTCNVPAPLHRLKSIQWDIELEYEENGMEGNETELKIEGTLEDTLYYRNTSDGDVKELVIKIVPEATFSISGKPLPNDTMTITREKFNEREPVSFVHSYEITNYGPSNSYQLIAHMQLPEMVILSNIVNGCEVISRDLDCFWAIPAKVSLPIRLQLKIDLDLYAETLENATTVNITTVMTLLLENGNLTTLVTTTLILDPAFPIWPLIVGLLIGLLLLAVITLALYKYGFFSRKRREELNRLKRETLPMEQDTSSSAVSLPTMIADESTRELITDDSE